MAVLHTVNKSPFATNSLKSALSHALKGDTILLIEDGIYGALDNSELSEMVKNKLDEVKIIALKPDLLARSISDERLIEGISTTDYDGFVDLATSHDVTEAWL